jgi:hypothetical protein
MILPNAEAVAAAQYSAAPYANDGGGYGCGQPPYFGFSSSCPTGIISSRPGSSYRADGSISAGTLHWQNGSSTIHACPGISYYPMGSNGSRAADAGFSVSGSGGYSAGLCFGR